MSWFQRIQKISFAAVIVLLGLFCMNAQPAHAGAVQSDSPIAFSLISCSGEIVDFSGNLHTATNVVYDGSGGAHLNASENLQGVTGIGETSGLKYQLPGTFHQTENFTAGLAFNVTETLNEDAVSQGSSPNLKIHELFHITVDANGNVTSYMDTFTITCNG